MARIIRNESKLARDYEKLEEDYQEKSKKAFAWIKPGLAGLFLGILGVVVSGNPALLAVGFAVFMICMIGGGTVLGTVDPDYRKNRDVYRAGMNGEKLTESVLSTLPDSYLIVPNVQLRVQQRKGEIDHLVLGDNGIFVVETKNYKGTLSGDVHDGSLTKDKYSSGGTLSTKTVTNPVRQVKRETMMLKDILAEAGIRKRVESLVFFSDLDLDYSVTGFDPNVQVFLAGEDGNEQMLEYIQRSRKAHLSDWEKQVILNRLLEPENPGAGIKVACC